MFYWTFSLFHSNLPKYIFICHTISSDYCIVKIFFKILVLCKSGYLLLSHHYFYRSDDYLLIESFSFCISRSVLFCILSFSEVFFSFLFKSVSRFLTLTNVAFCQVSFSISCNFVTLSFPYFSRRSSTSDLFITLCSLPFLPYMFTQQHYGVRQVSCACGISLTSKMTFYSLKPLK